MTDASNAIIEWDPNSGGALPAHITGAMDELGTNIPERDRVPSLSYEGKVWSIIKDGNKQRLESANNDGDVVPIPVMRMVILNFAAERGRAYYEGEYDPAKAEAPKCWSADGKAPDPSVVEKMSASCNGCPMSVKGSKVRDGKELVACSSHRLIAVAPAFDIEGDALRLKIAVTSDYDKEISEHGWFAFRQYNDFLKSRGITHTGLVVTKVKFDGNVAYPKLLFALDRILTVEEVQQVKNALQNPKLEDLINERWTPAGGNGTPSNDSDIRPKPEDPNHIHAAGTVDEKWWDGVAWVDPWNTGPIAPPVSTLPPPPVDAAPKVAEKSGLEKAADDGWAPHPQAPGYHYKGQEVVADADLEARYAGNAPASADTAPSSAPDATQESSAPTSDSGQTVTTAASPSEPPVAQPDPMDAARADGWVAHPEAPGYHYKGQEVVDDATLAARYAGNSASTSTAGSTPTGAGTTETAASAGGGAAATPNATGEVPADVADLLNKWS